VWGFFQTDKFLVSFEDWFGAEHLLTLARKTSARFTELSLESAF
jgi:hypothetical protein